MSWRDFDTYNSSTNPWLSPVYEHNNILDHGLEKTASYIIRKNGSYYEALLGGTTSGGTIAYGSQYDVGSISGSSAHAVFNAVQAALNTAGGGFVYVKAGTYSCTGNITAYPKVWMVGEGNEVTIITFSAGYGILVNSGGATSDYGGGVYHMSIKADTAACITVDNVGMYEVVSCKIWTSGTTYTYGVRFVNFAYIGLVQHCEFRHYGTAGISCEDTSHGTCIVDTYFNPPDNDSSVGINVESSGVKIQNCWMEHTSPRKSTHIVLTGSGCTNTFITGNTFAGLHASGSYYCIHIKSSAAKAVISNNYIAPVYGTAVYIASGSGTGHHITDNEIRYAGSRAIDAVASEGIIQGNHIEATTAVTDECILITGNRWTISDNQILGDGAIAEKAIMIAGGSANTRIKDNTIRNFATCIDLGASTSGTDVIGNHFLLHTTGVSGATYANIIKDNTGFVTSNHGVDAVPNGSTSVVVNHGLVATPTKLQITPITNPTNDVVCFWQTSAGATTFQVNTDQDPGATTFGFWWQASVYE